MIHEDIGDGKFVDLHSDDHGVVLGWVDGDEVVICENYRWNPWSAFGGY